MAKIPKLFKKGKGPDAAPPHDQSQVSFKSFQQAIAGNKAILELMAEMSDAGGEREFTAKGAIPLQAEIPVSVRLLDLGGGIRPGVKQVTPADILSLPMAAILRGMIGSRWPGPPPVDGFPGLAAGTATLVEGRLVPREEKSIAILGKNYLRFSIRLGYHFSLVEAWVSEEQHDNYIRFVFKGGGAPLDRRLRRVKLIGDILRVLGFRVRLVEDAIDAAMVKYPLSDLGNRLTVLGKLTAYTKQLDMAMFNNEVADWYRNEFVHEHIPLPGHTR